jgi:hypothetical protein
MCASAISAMALGAGKAFHTQPSCIREEAALGRHRHVSIIPGRRGNFAGQVSLSRTILARSMDMNGLIYLVGLVVVILAILSFFGLR